jgi:hypothetical protein
MSFGGTCSRTCSRLARTADGFAIVFPSSMSSRSSEPHYEAFARFPVVFTSLPRNPTKYRPHRPQGSKSAYLQVICAGDVASGYRPQTNIHRPHS